MRTDKLIFIHIPKTGGRNTLKLISPFYRKVFPYGLWEGYLNHKNILSQYKLYGGHSGYGIRDILPRNIPIFTFVRNPIEHFYSYISHTQRRKHYLSGEYEFKTIEEALEIPEVVNVISNIQTLYLGVDYPYKSNKELETYQYKDWGKLLANAKKRITDDIIYVGIKENYKKSILELLEILGITKKISIWERHTQYNITIDTRKKLEKINEVDIELYNFVKEGNNGKNSLHTSR